MSPLDQVDDHFHDPILRLDQFIHRQDEQLRMMKVQLEATKMVIFLLAILVFQGLVLIVYLIWK